MTLKINRREKYAIYVATGCVFLFVLFQFIVFPIFEKRTHLKNSLQVKTKMLEEMHILKSEYEAIKEKNEWSEARFSKRKQGFTLFSFLDELAGEADVKEHITYMKPSKSAQPNSKYQISMVELKLQQITLKQLADYLYKVETSENMVSISRLSIQKTGKEEGFINVVLQVETLEI